MSLNQESIVAASDSEVVKVSVPEWGGHVYITTISAYERDKWEESVNNGERIDLTNLRAKLVVLCLSDKDGKRIFPDLPKGADTLGNKSGVVLDRLYGVAKTLNKIGPKDIEELAGN